MRKLIALIGLLVTTITLSTPVVADDAEPEPLYIESAVFILNIKNSAPGTIDGTILATPCTGCAPITLKLDNSTIVYLNGKPVEYNQLGLKIDWTGSVFYTPSRFPVATELFLNQN
ncbi:hypothetical protein [Pseudomonas sp. M30-35]|uniref:hypothetical protein n=1 Tax=Pseudomonas sp. M30-35 TaxID=1981174 RepID=UPI000B3CD35B|nr:hypothetical protein [Pseudomonas sp. M30-35]ARU89809.1 hypothetical protein B9K09_18345 [Pseudomonas sp. M30-35]